MGVGMKYIKTCLVILYLTVGKGKIGHHVLTVVDNKVVPIIKEMSYKATYQNLEGEVLLILENDIDL